MIYTFYNKKGGTGKTTLSFNLAKDKDYIWLSNDDSVIPDIYEKGQILDKIKVYKDKNIVYDLGGYIDNQCIDLFKASDKIIIHTLLDVNSIKRTINTILEIDKYCQNIIIIINKYTTKNIEKFKQSIDILKGFDKDILYLKESEAYVNSIHTGDSIKEQYKKSNLTKHTYKKVYKEYKIVLTHIKGEN